MHNVMFLHCRQSPLLSTKVLKAECSGTVKSAMEKNSINCRGQWDTEAKIKRPSPEMTY